MWPNCLFSIQRINTHKRTIHIPSHKHSIHSSDSQFRSIHLPTNATRRLQALCALDNARQTRSFVRTSAIPKVQRQLIEKKTRDLFTKLNDFEDKSKRLILLRFSHSTCVFTNSILFLRGTKSLQIAFRLLRSDQFFFLSHFRVLGSHFEFDFIFVQCKRKLTSKSTNGIHSKQRRAVRQ